MKAKKLSPSWRVSQCSVPCGLDPLEPRLCFSSFTGTSGNDDILFYRAGGNYFIQLDIGRDGTIDELDNHGSTLANNEMVIDGGDGNDKIESDLTISSSLGIAVTLIGNLGNDDLQGTGSTSDFLDASAGNDTMRVGLGNDSLAGGSNIDLAFADTDSTFKVDWSSDGVANDKMYQNGTLIADKQSVSAEKLTGTPGNDTVVKK